eukprot:gene28058-36972_t
MASQPRCPKILAGEALTVKCFDRTTDRNSMLENRSTPQQHSAHLMNFERSCVDIDIQATVSSIVNRLGAYEQQRKLVSTTSLLRNDAYWRELQAMQTDALNDSARFVNFLKEKVQVFRILATTITSTPSTLPTRSRITGTKTDISADTKGKVSEPDLSSASTGIFNLVSTTAESSAGNLAAKTLSELDDTCEKKIHDLVSRLTKQLKANENDMKFLWKRGNDLLFARNLADQRSQLCWEVLRSHIHNNNKSNAVSNAAKKDLSALVPPEAAE